MKSNLRNYAVAAVLGIVMTEYTYADVSGFSGFQLNGNGSAIQAGYPYLDASNSKLSLMNGQNEISVSAWYPTPQTYVNGFTASFTYAGGFATVQKGIADGFTFALQNSPSGLSALGNAGGALGFEGGNPTELSFAVGIGGKIGGGSHIGYVLNHSYPQNEQGTPGIGLDFSNGANLPVQFTVAYDPSVNDRVLGVTAVQGGNTWSYNFDVGQNLQSILGGSTALVGFTAGAGGDTSSQEISNFSFTESPASVPEPSVCAMVLMGAAMLLGYRRRA